MDAQEKLEQGILRVFERRVRTWEDMYKLMEEQSQAAVETGSPHIAFGAIFMQQSFLQALRELPDEGDITVLAAHTAHLLVHDIGPRLGAKVDLGLSTDVLDAYDDAERDAAQQEKARDICSTLLAGLRAGDVGKKDKP